MSQIIIIDDDLDDEPVQPVKAPRQHCAQKQQQPIYISSDDQEEEQQQQAKRRSAKRSRPAATHEEEDEDEAWDGAAAAAAAAGSPAKQKGKKQPRQPRKAKEPKEKRTDELGRTVRYSAQPSAAVYQRIQRALPGSGHRMFLISTEQVAAAGASGGRSQAFVVLGATGNVYNVRISRHPDCDCPDHAKGNLCKHILFVMLRVLKLATDNPLVWQKALLTKEVEEVLSGAHSQGVSHLNGVLAEAGVRQAYAAATGQAGGAGAAAAAGGGGGGGRKPIAGDCPICFNELEEGEEPLLWCQASCGNNVHKQCFARWAAAKRGNGQQVTCVYCRAAWQGEGGDAGAAVASPGGGSGSYLNLAQHSQQHREADTSLQALYGESSMWIHYHQGGGAQGGRGGMARMWRSGNYGRPRN